MECSCGRRAKAVLVVRAVATDGVAVGDSTLLTLPGCAGVRGRMDEPEVGPVAAAGEVIGGTPSAALRAALSQVFGSGTEDVAALARVV
ncbi:hypothetical protein CBM2599_B30231 [Cupriavidus taiwanensis]|nr:hypothetical protein CBM2599_B30231 [Cupriavidus taiwanensis]SOY99109.1 hypothetical protein CBM2600_B40071 [Cupriavidus taiwanensis]